MACGMIRGALANIGVNSVVTAEVSAMPACMYSSYFLVNSLFLAHQSRRHCPSALILFTYLQSSSIILFH